MSCTQNKLVQQELELIFEDNFFLLMAGSAEIPVEESSYFQAHDCRCEQRQQSAILFNHVMSQRAIGFNNSFTNQARRRESFFSESCHHMLHPDK